MAAYLRYVKHPGVARYLLTLLTFALGLMAKPMLVTLPFVLLLLDYWPLARIPSRQTISKTDRQNKKHMDIHSYQRILYYLIREKIPFFALSAASSTITFLAQREAVVPITSIPLKLRISNALVSYVEYIGKMLWPSRLAVFYPHPAHDLAIWQTAALLLLLLAISILVLRLAAAAGRKYLLTGWLWYLGTLVPVIGLVQVGSQAMADRYSYMTLTGLFIIIAWGLPDLLGKWPHWKIALWASSLIVLSALAICAHLQQRYWKNTLTLCEHALKVTENNYEAHFYIAHMLLEQGRIEEAIWHNTEAVRINPNHANAINNLGVALHKAGRIDEAIYYFKRVLEIKPSLTEAHLSLAAALATKGEFDEAIRHYRIALETADIIPLHRGLGYALLKLGRFEEAVAEYRKVLSAMPNDPDILNKLGYALAHIGKLDEAIREYRKCLQMEPNDLNALNGLGVTLGQQGKFDEAVKCFTEALRIKPDSAEAHTNLGFVLILQGSLDEAAVHLGEALRLDTNSEKAHYYLGQILAQRGKLDEAITHFEESLRLKPDWVEPMNDLAWFLAASQKTTAHNPDKALRLAQRACELTNYSKPELLDTLAVAYAAAGSFSKAIETAEKALELCRSPKQKTLKDEIENRLVLYKTGKPYIEK